MDEHEPLDVEEPGDEELYDLPEEMPEEMPAEAAAGSRQRFDADFLLDKVIPGEIDWRNLVRRHPWLCVGVAAGIGLAVGRSKGPAIIAGVSAALSGAVMRQLSDVFDGEIFEF